jgi:hypothetical protein
VDVGKPDDFTLGMERLSVTYVDISNISVEVFVTVLLFLLIIAPLFSLAILRFFQGRPKAGFTLIATGIIIYFVLQLVGKLFF